MQNESDHQLFIRAMRGVKPIKKKHLLKNEPTVLKISKLVRRKIFKPEIEPIYLTAENMVPYAAEERVFFVRPGLQQKTIRQLRQGKIPYEKILDLHALTLREAKQKLELFLARCAQQNNRVVLLVHGKGTAKLKSAVITWLQNYAETLGIASAQPEDGGAGALYLLLRK